MKWRVKCLKNSIWTGHHEPRALWSSLQMTWSLGKMLKQGLSSIFSTGAHTSSSTTTSLVLLVAGTRTFSAAAAVPGQSWACISNCLPTSPLTLQLLTHHHRYALTTVAKVVIVLWEALIERCRSLLHPLHPMRQQQHPPQKILKLPGWIVSWG